MSRNALDNQTDLYISKVYLTSVIEMDFAIAKISSKGQIVIPSPLRLDIKRGDEFLIIKDNGRFIMKNMRDVANELKDDIHFAERVEQAWKRHDKGRFKTRSKKDFLKELKSW